MFDTVDNLTGLHTGHLVFLAISLVIAFGFEFVNGFHDTANAVATVIYTKSLRPMTAVLISGIFNLLGVLLGGIGVAFSIVHLLPVDLLVNIDTNAGLAMILSLLGAAILWNLGTWRLGLPASSSHTLIGSIMGVGLTHSLMRGESIGGGVNWSKAGEVGLSLLISPIVGFGLAALLLLIAKRLIRNPILYEEPRLDAPPPWWVRGILISTCSGVSFAHGSNDGQKGMGLIMLILIGVVPTQYALNLQRDDQCRVTREAAAELERFLAQTGLPTGGSANSSVTPVVATAGLDIQGITALQSRLAAIAQLLEGKESFDQLSAQSRWAVRTEILEIDNLLAHLERAVVDRLSADRRKILNGLRSDLNDSIEYVPTWVIVMVALSLGVGTTVGWKRIVVTVGEKIGKSHLTYAQGASAEIVATAAIGMADVLGMPVSTTHVLSSGVAGTMWANRSGINFNTVRSIALAWVLTLPAAMLLSGLLLVVSTWLFV